MQDLKKVHYSCLCFVCHKLIEYPMCNDCIEEAERAEEWLVKPETGDRQSKTRKG